MSFEPRDFSASPAPIDRIAMDDGRRTLALFLGAAAALAAGGIWAALVFVTDMEIGFVAWGVGLLVGVAMSRATINRSRGLAYAAAAFAVIGLLAGKAFIFAGSTNDIANEVEKNDPMMAGAMAWQMYANQELDTQTMSAVDAARAAGDTLTDELWRDMQAQGAAKLAAMSPAEKHQVALLASQDVKQSMGVIGGITAQLSLFDLLWLFLAVGTAYQMMAPAKQAPSSAPSGQV